MSIHVVNVDGTDVRMSTAVYKKYVVARREEKEAQRQKGLYYEVPVTSSTGKRATIGMTPAVLEKYEQAKREEGTTHYSQADPIHFPNQINIDEFHSINQGTASTEQLMSGERKKEAKADIDRAYYEHFDRPIDTKLGTLSTDPNAPQMVTFSSEIMKTVGRPLSMIFGHPDIREKTGTYFSEYPVEASMDFAKGIIAYPLMAGAAVVSYGREGETGRAVGSMFGSVVNIAAAKATTTGISKGIGYVRSQTIPISQSVSTAKVAYNPKTQSGMADINIITQVGGKHKAAYHTEMSSFMKQTGKASSRGQKVTYTSGTHASSTFAQSGKNVGNMGFLTRSSTTQLDKALSTGRTGVIGVKGQDPMVMASRQMNIKTGEVAYNQPHLIDVGGKFFKTSKEATYMSYGQGATTDITGFKFSRIGGQTVKVAKGSGKPASAGEGVYSSRVFTIESQKDSGFNFFKGTGTKTLTKPTTQSVDPTLTQLGKAIDIAKVVAEKSVRKDMMPSLTPKLPTVALIGMTEKTRGRTKTAPPAQTMDFGMDTKSKLLHGLDTKTGFDTRSGMEFGNITESVSKPKYKETMDFGFGMLSIQKQGQRQATGLDMKTGFDTPHPPTPTPPTGTGQGIPPMFLDFPKGMMSMKGITKGKKGRRKREYAYTPSLAGMLDIIPSVAKPPRAAQLGFGFRPRIKRKRRGK